MMKIYKSKILLNIALGLLILASQGLAQKLSPKQQRKHAMYEFKMKHGNQWEIHWNKNTGTVASILGHTTAPFSGSPVAIAKQFLRAEKQMLGIKSVDPDLKPPIQKKEARGFAFPKPTKAFLSLTAVTW